MYSRENSTGDGQTTMPIYYTRGDDGCLVEGFTGAPFYTHRPLPVVRTKTERDAAFKKDRLMLLQAATAFQKRERDAALEAKLTAKRAAAAEKLAAARPSRDDMVQDFQRAPPRSPPRRANSKRGGEVPQSFSNAPSAIPKSMGRKRQRTVLDHRSFFNFFSWSSNRTPKEEEIILSPEDVEKLVNKYQLKRIVRKAKQERGASDGLSLMERKRRAEEARMESLSASGLMRLPGQGHAEPPPSLRASGFGPPAPSRGNGGDVSPVVSRRGSPAPISPASPGDDAHFPRESARSSSTTSRGSDRSDRSGGSARENRSARRNAPPPPPRSSRQYSLDDGPPRASKAAEASQATPPRRSARAGLDGDAPPPASPPPRKASSAAPARPGSRQEARPAARPASRQPARPPRLERSPKYDPYRSEDGDTKTEQL